MNSNEMKSAFLLRYDKIATLSSPDFEDSEIEDFLNQSQDRITLRQYIPKGNKYDKGFEMNEKRRRDLAELVSTAILTSTNFSTSQTGAHNNGKFIDLPDKFLYAVEEYVTFTGTDEVEVKPVEHDFYTANIRNPYKKPFANLVWRMNISRTSHGTGEETAGNAPTAKRVELITHGPTITTYFIRYLSEPRRIVIDESNPTNQISCQLDNSLHGMIVDEAVKIATGITQPELYQIKSNEVLNDE